MTFASKRGPVVDPLAPAPGYYLLRMAPKAWMVPCEITLAGGRYSFIIDGQHIGDYTSGDLADMVENRRSIDQLIYFGQRCTCEEYRLRTEIRLWAQANDPDHAALHPTRPIDLSKTKAVEF